MSLESDLAVTPPPCAKPDCGQTPAAHLGWALGHLYASPHPDPDKRHYRVLAERISSDHPGAATITCYAYAHSVGEAASLVLRKHERPRGLFGVGLYRIVKVEEYPYRQEEQPPPAADATAPETPGQYNARRLPELLGLARSTLTHLHAKLNPMFAGQLANWSTREIALAVADLEWRALATKQEEQPFQGGNGMTDRRATTPEDIVERVLDQILREDDELDTTVAAENIIIALRTTGWMPPAAGDSR